MRAIKNTSLSFGMVNVPIKLYSAVEDHDVKLNQFHIGCGGGVGYHKVCKCCDETLDTASIVKGKIVDDVQVLITDDDLANLDITVGPEVTVMQFCKSAEIDAIAIEGHYFAAPAADAGLEGFTALRDAMEESGLVALVKFVMRRSGSVGKEHLGVLRPYQRAMLIDTIHFADEIRQPAFSILDKPIQLNPKVAAMARSLVDSMVEPYDPHAYGDVFTTALSDLIELKAAGGEAPKATAKVDAGGGDLLSKLEASAAVAKRKKAPAKAAPAKAAARKAAPAKAAPTKRVAKKTATSTRSRKAVA